MNRKIILLTLMFLLSYTFVQADEYIWRPGTITLSIKNDNKYLKIGQYLQLENRLLEGEYGWTQSKMDLPDSWIIERLRFVGEHLVFKNQYGELFSIKPPKLNALDFELLNGGKKSNRELEILWRKFALADG